MSEDRFGWLGESRRLALMSLIKTEVDQWASEWWVHHVSGEVAVQPVDPTAGVACQSLAYVAATTTGSLSICLDGKDMDAIGRHLAGVVDHDASGWAQRIGEEALAALAARIFRRAGEVKSSPLSESVESPGLMHAHLGVLHASIVLGRLRWRLTIDRRMADRLVPPAEALAEKALVARSDALEQACLRVNAIVDFGSVNLADLSDLCVGEVLVGERSLHETLQLHVDGFGAVASGYLKRRGTKRAVMLDDRFSHGNES